MLENLISAEGLFTTAEVARALGIDESLVEARLLALRGDDVRPVPVRTSSLDLDAAQLRPGQAFARYTEPARGGRVDILDVPCCGRAARVTAPEPPSGDVYLVLCVQCRKAYKAELTADIDGGWDAVLTVETIEFTTTRGRRT